MNTRVVHTPVHTLEDGRTSVPIEERELEAGGLN